MSEDIVERLRAEAVALADQLASRLEEAADEIERLRAEVERKHDYACRMDALAEERLMEITRLRAAGDALAATWPKEDRCNCDNADCRAVVAAYTAWQEARRG